MQIRLKSFEVAHRLLVSVFGYRDPVFFGAHIDAGCVWITYSKGRVLLFSGAFFSSLLILPVAVLAHSTLSLLGVIDGCALARVGFLYTLLNGIVHR